jgi:hypothetical protein
MKNSENLEVFIHMFRGRLHLFRGSFLAVFSVEFVLCSENLDVCIHMFWGSLHLFRGSFLAVFSVEFVLCSACDLSLHFFGFGHELSLFVFLSSYFLPFPEFHFALCVVNALIKGETEDQEHPGGRWMTAPQ